MDSQLTREALELLSTLDQEQRTDLSVHLYSAHLLKQLLYRANKDEKKILRTETFVKTVLREGWTAWPTPDSIIDPNTTAIYEDQQDDDEVKTSTKHGQLDQESLNHGTAMLYGELNAFWQQKLKESSLTSRQIMTDDEEEQEQEAEEAEEEELGGRVHDTVLDVNAMDLPQDIFQNVMFKLDTFIGSLHLDAAEINTVTLSTVPGEPDIKWDSGKLGTMDAVTLKSKEKYDYKDIIVHACEVGEDMSQEYLQAIDLFQDLPKTLDKSQFVLPDSYLDRFSQLNLGTSDSEQSDVEAQNHAKKKKGSNIEQDNISYVQMKRIINDRTNDPVVRREARLLLRRDEFARDKKMFYTVLNHQKTSEELAKPTKRLKKNKKKDKVSLDIDSDYGLTDLD
ncbi:unnamed protein product [Kluyveromyces dobzhanskii CBS 2104]|uniref:WGS project CCBQ000000000 data, contig 00098 n=1 Tax=Kluyveromyces dobzhanskii CBS 2104 TaxID=1427455 RepID=A0A0A8L5J7_9SACH|nr:unnamed protein product [Kluyveromyces dobzhanskii CBS 2104]